MENNNFIIILYLKFKIIMVILIQFIHFYNHIIIYNIQKNVNQNMIQIVLKLKDYLN